MVLPFVLFLKRATLQQIRCLPLQKPQAPGRAWRIGGTRPAEVDGQLPLAPERFHP
jgi:hypothetical protein